MLVSPRILLIAYLSDVGEVPCSEPYQTYGKMFELALNSVWVRTNHRSINRQLVVGLEEPKYHYIFLAK